jgi:phosphate transport system protein
MAADTRHFAEELEELKQRLLAMGGLAEERVRTALRGLVARDRALLLEVIGGDQAVNALQVEIDDRCFKLLALHQPMAVDLRFIVSVVKINSDLERVGDLAVNIAEAADRYLAHPPVEARIDLTRMGAVSQRMLREALDAFVQADTALAHEVLKQDDVLDALKDQTFRTLLATMLADPRTIEPAINLILIARHLERIGDHATNVAEDVIFIVNAMDVRHHAADASAG